MKAIDKLIATAEAELGYLEKKSNKDLDDKTANAGSSNYTKYNRDLKAWTGVGSISAQWCQAFVDWVFITAFGLEGAKKLIYTGIDMPLTAISEFEEKGKTDPFYAKLHELTAKTGGLWNLEAEKFILENCKY